MSNVSETKREDWERDRARIIQDLRERWQACVQRISQDNTKKEQFKKVIEKRTHSSLEDVRESHANSIGKLDALSKESKLAVGAFLAVFNEKAKDIDENQKTIGYIDGIIDRLEKIKSRSELEEYLKSVRA